MKEVLTQLRRLRGHPKLRSLLTHTWLNKNDFVQPLFICPEKSVHNPIASLPGQYQISIDQLPKTIDTLLDLGLPAVLLFGVLPDHEKDELGRSSYCDDGLIQQAIREIKRRTSDLLVIADVCLCEYTSHGHCGVVEKNKNDTFYVDNTKTLALLAKQAVSLAQAGADILAPSAMMDGMVYALRQALQEVGLNHVPILSYAVKYASAFYEPFREAAQGPPRFGDRRTYQMNPAAARGEALREAELDVEEGADILMVKPGHTYLDIIYQLKEKQPNIPIAAYHVSGEYAMLKAAIEAGWINNERLAVFEIMTAMKRAGADFIITYYARDIAKWLRETLPF